MKAVTKVVIETRGDIGNIKLSSEDGQDYIWKSTSFYIAASKGSPAERKYKILCTKTDYLAERDRLFEIYTKRSPFVAVSFKEWLKTYKENNMWMPEVGEECECTWGIKSTWIKCYLLKGGFVIVDDSVAKKLKKHNISEYKGDEEFEFRPIQSEEDGLTEKAFKSLTIDNSDLAYKVCQDLVQDGWRPIKPMTEDEFVEWFMVYVYDCEQIASTAYRAGCRFLDGGE